MDQVQGNRRIARTVLPIWWLCSRLLTSWNANPNSDAKSVMVLHSKSGFAVACDNAINLRDELAAPADSKIPPLSDTLSSE